jgi:hypothetical protein
MEENEKCELIDIAREAYLQEERPYPNEHA